MSPTLYAFLWFIAGFISGIFIASHFIRKSIVHYGIIHINPKADDSNANKLVFEFTRSLPDIPKHKEISFNVSIDEDYASSKTFEF